MDHQLGKIAGALTIGQGAGVGATVGGAAGALKTLFSEDKSLREWAKNIAIGGAAGGVIGGGVKAIDEIEPEITTSSWSTEQAKPKATTAAPTGKSDDDKMSLPIAALSGIVPGLGPGIHGIASQGLMQGLGSATSSVVPAQAAYMLASNPTGSKARAIVTLLSSLGSVGAAHAGNKMRES